MKSYPKIQGSSKAPKQQCIAFYKYDGSNIRVEWQRKKGWCKFGTRKRLFDESDEIFGEAIPLFHDTMAKDIEAVLKKKFRDDNPVTVFMEFFGPNSFAGQHESNDQKELVLFDVNLYKKGLISPRDFVKYFNTTTNSAKVVYEGNLNEEFIKDVREGKYDLDEGVICKGGKNHDLWMCKIKTNAYLKRLKETFHDKWEDYWE